MATGTKTANMINREARLDSLRLMVELLEVYVEDDLSPAIQRKLAGVSAQALNWLEHEREYGDGVGSGLKETGQ